MAHEHKDILFEGRDTQDKKIFIFGLWLFAVMIGTSLLMIPLVKHLWHWAQSANPKVEKSAAISTPQVILEVHPSRDYQDLKKNIETAQTSEKIEAAVRATLEEGLPVKA